MAPLYCYSAMSFEAANRVFGKIFAGAHSECEIICRRVLMRQKLTNIETQDPHLKYLISKINSDFDNNNDASMSYELVQTNAVKMGRMLYPEAEFLNRHLINGVYFDSHCYKRSKNGNYFVWFVRDNMEFYGQILYFIKISGPPLIFLKLWKRLGQ